jgi:hypothetical protein
VTRIQPRDETKANLSFLSTHPFLAWPRHLPWAIARRKKIMLNPDWALPSDQFSLVSLEDNPTRKASRVGFPDSAPEYPTAAPERLLPQAKIVLIRNLSGDNILRRNRKPD